jgi:hypothetical protein
MNPNFSAVDYDTHGLRQLCATVQILSGTGTIIGIPSIYGKRFLVQRQEIFTSPRRHVFRRPDETDGIKCDLTCVWDATLRKFFATSIYIHVAATEEIFAVGGEENAPRLSGSARVAMTGSFTGIPSLSVAGSMFYATAIRRPSYAPASVPLTAISYAPTSCGGSGFLCNNVLTSVPFQGRFTDLADGFQLTGGSYRFFVTGTNLWVNMGLESLTLWRGCDFSGANLMSLGVDTPFRSDFADHDPFIIREQTLETHPHGCHPSGGRFVFTY